MKVAILCESSADEAALRVLVDAILARPTLPAGLPHYRDRGWPGVGMLLDPLIQHLHYHTDADGLVVVADANGTSVVADDEKNRLRGLQRIAREALAKLRPSPGRTPLRVAVGVASPTIEAWLLSPGTDAYSEAVWERGLRRGPPEYSKFELKEKLYGTRQPTLVLEEARMLAAAKKAADDLDALARLFPAGFGGLREALLSWGRT